MEVEARRLEVEAARLESAHGDGGGAAEVGWLEAAHGRRWRRRREAHADAVKRRREGAKEYGDGDGDGAQEDGDGQMGTAAHISSVRFYSAHPIPASLSNATALVALNLANNSFAGQVPAEIGTLCALLLELSNNKLTATDAGGGWEFMDNLTKCSALAEILLYGNKFAGVMPSFNKDLVKTAT
uniref:Leucine-rich repeat-containing N-terminal plant-type domain-containing protein n=1 Tax=Oryza nivara TaxID=4536 RepID=A0A0E0G6E0_ORYNI